MSEMGLLANQVVEEELPYATGSEKSLMVSRASGWFSSNLGKLNTRLFTAFSGENPGLKLEEQHIYKMLFMAHFYKSKASSVLKNMDTSSIDMISISEGDSRVQFQNKNEVAKTFKQLYRETAEEIDKLVSAYNIYQASPLQSESVH